MKKRVLAIVLSITMLAGVIVGCGSPTGTEENNTAASKQEEITESETPAEQPTEDVEKAETDEPLKIGYAQANAGDEFRAAWLKSFSEKAESRGYTLLTTDASDDISKQISDVESLILQGCDVIAVNGLDSEGIIPALEAIKAAGIKCVLVDTTVTNEELYDCMICEDSMVTGRKQGEYIKAWLEEKGVEPRLGYVVGMYSMTFTLGRRDGVYEVLDIEEPVVENEAMWKANSAMTLAEDWMQAYPDLNVIACMNDDMAVGVIQALNSAGKNMDDILVVGVDGLSAGANYIKEGSLDATVARDLDAETSLYMEVCEKLAVGETVDKQIAPESSFVMDASNVNEYYPD